MLGGNTSCVALGLDDAGPALVLDAGSGIRAVTSMLGGQPFRGAILLSHLHWDHTHGLPFFAGADRPGAQVTVLAPAQGVPLFDVLAARWPRPISRSPRESSAAIGDSTVSRRDSTRSADSRCSHARSRTRVDAPTATGSASPGARSHTCRTIARRESGRGPPASGNCTMPHWSWRPKWTSSFTTRQLLTAELPERADFGHAAAAYAVELAVAADARQVVLFHHDPGTHGPGGAGRATRSASLWARGDLGVSLAYEGLTLDIGGRRRRPAL